MVLLPWHEGNSHSKRIWIFALLLDWNCGIKPFFLLGWRVILDLCSVHLCKTFMFDLSFSHAVYSLFKPGWFHVTCTESEVIFFFLFFLLPAPLPIEKERVQASHCRCWLLLFNSIHVLCEKRMMKEQEVKKKQILLENHALVWMCGHVAFVFLQNWVFFFHAWLTDVPCPVRLCNLSSLTGCNRVFLISFWEFPILLAFFFSI